MRPPDEPLNCLLVYPAFPADTFWNMKETCRSVGAGYPFPPLGLLTVAALLPRQWRFHLLDLNCHPFSEELWRQADVICVSGMITQQAGTLALIERAKREGRFLVVGGPDPTVQPELYRDAAARVLGEGELAIPMWLDAWRAGNPYGVVRADGRPVVARSPTPRFDLLDFDDYLEMSVQFSRGCPFLCEFCDIIELYGRVPRTKTNEQLLAELETLYRLGYRGQVTLIDDNFIGNKKAAKKLLPVLADWCRAHDHPFFFAAEVSLNVADDADLLAMLQAIDLRLIFTGIETPDPVLLKQTRKAQNTGTPLADRVRRLNAAGILVTASFILGFDGEPAGTGDAIADCIEDNGICFAAIGLLTALPTTQLSRRLLREKRLLDSDGNVVEVLQGAWGEYAVENRFDGQHGGGLNFVPTRPRAEILREYRRALARVYDPDRYFARVVRMAAGLRGRRKHRPSVHELRRARRGLTRMLSVLGRDPATRGPMLRALARLPRAGLDPAGLEMAMKMMVAFLHFHHRTRAYVATLDRRIEEEAAKMDG